MPMVGGPEVLLEIVPATYAKIRAELRGGTVKGPGICFSFDGEKVLMTERR